MEVPSGNLRTEFESVTELNSFSYPNLQSDTKVIPVIDINPKHARNAEKVYTQTRTTTDASSVLLYSVGSREEFFITSASLSLVKNDTCDLASGTWGITVQPYGEATAKVFLNISLLTLTAQNQTVSISFPSPLRVARSTDIRISACSHTAGSCVRSASIIGYTVALH